MTAVDLKTKRAAAGIPGYAVCQVAVIRWFQDMPGVLRLSQPSNNGRRARIELRIPYSIAMREYRRRTVQS